MNLMLLVSEMLGFPSNNLFSTDQTKVELFFFPFFFLTRENTNGPGLHTDFYCLIFDSEKQKDKKIYELPLY